MLEAFQERHGIPPPATQVPKLLKPDGLNLKQLNAVSHWIFNSSIETPHRTSVMDLITNAEPANRQPGALRCRYSLATTQGCLSEYSNDESTWLHCSPYYGTHLGLRDLVHYLSHTRQLSTVRSVENLVVAASNLATRRSQLV